MRKVIFFVASSLDGFIARKDGGIDWLYTDGDFGHKAFYQSVDAILSGRKTYDLAKSFGSWPYPGKACYVFTRKKLRADKNVIFSKNPIGLTRKLRKQKGKDIWLVGGGELAATLIRAGLVDKIVISIHPVILGSGIPLFTGIKKESWFELTKRRVFPRGLLQLTYRKR